MTCLGLTVVYGLRVNLSVAIVQMNNDTATVPHNGSALVTGQPPSLTIPYMYCTGGTEMPQLSSYAG